ncbi:hypothetical protein GEMRC1_000172 [Eukaryota sp. GEM-RC1]
MSGFSRAEKTQLLAAVKAGDLHKIKSLINSSSSPFIPDELIAKTIMYLRRHIVKDTELFFKGYPVISFNRKGQQQERFLLVTASALYHIKYDFALQQIHHVKRFPLSAISHVYWGHLCNDYSSPPPRGNQTKRSVLAFGLQVHFKADTASGGIVTSSGVFSPVRTYVPLLSSTCPEGSSRAVAEEMSIPIESSLVHISQNSLSTSSFTPSGIVIQHEITRPSGGLISMFYNGLKLGFWNKTKCRDPLDNDSLSDTSRRGSDPS